MKKKVFAIWSLKSLDPVSSCSEIYTHIIFKSLSQRYETIIHTLRGSGCTFNGKPVLMFLWRFDLGRFIENPSPEKLLRILAALWKRGLCKLQKINTE